MILASPQALSYTPRRIVSLVPSQTELLHYLQLEAETVGITRFCVHPAAWFRNKTRVGGTRDLHNDIIRELRPDLIIANKEENRQEEIEALAADFPVWVTDVGNLEEALTMISDIGILTGRITIAAKLVKDIRAAFASIRPLPAGHPASAAAYLIWKDPLMAAGADTFISDMLRHCGLINLLATEKRYPVISLEQLREKKCALLLLSSEPYPFRQKHIDELQEALPGVRIELVDGEFFSWYGSRLREAPDYFNQFISNIL